MTEIVVGKGEPLDRALARFRRKVAMDGVLAEYRRHEYHVRRGLKRKMKAKRGRRRW